MAASASRRDVRTEKAPPICGVVVTYQPDPSFAARLSKIASECDRTVVVDNGTQLGPTTHWSENAEVVEILRQEQNLGLAAALNIGLRRAMQLGFDWAVTFDQDSTPDVGMVSELWYSRLGDSAHVRVAIVGSKVREEKLAHEEYRWLMRHPRCGLLFRRMPCRETDLSGVTFVITSGALLDLKAFREIGPMDETLFIDYIDHDYCLRARSMDFDIVVSARASLLHNLGAKRVVEVAGRPMRPTFHSAPRHYYMARNRILMWRRYAWRFPHWWLFDACYGGLNLVRVLAAEDQRRAKLAAALRGTWHGLLGRSGPMPP